MGIRRHTLHARGILRYGKLTSPKRDTCYLERRNCKAVLAFHTAAVPMQFIRNYLLRIPPGRKKAHVQPSQGDRGIRQANYLNRLILKKPSSPTPNNQSPMPKKKGNHTHPNTDGTAVSFIQVNLKKAGSKNYSRCRYEQYKGSTTVAAALASGASRGHKIGP